MTLKIYRLFWKLRKINITKHLRVIPNAWHFFISLLSSVFKVVWLNLVVALLTP
ncbi:DUF3265 domain-containing protein [Vibrio parahaemolyticus]|nr:DUF3265 domain-containing protein [Vibrio parahaemolyticus]